MASSKAYLNFVLDQLTGLAGITYRYHGKIAAYICDDRLLAKPVKAAITLLPNAPMEPPYKGAKDMLLVEQVDDRAFLQQLFAAMYDELPAPKSQKPRK